MCSCFNLFVFILYIFYMQSLMNKLYCLFLKCLFLFFLLRFFRLSLHAVQIFMCCHLLFQKILSGTLSECQTVWIKIRTDYVGSDLGPNCLKFKVFLKEFFEKVCRSQELNTVDHTRDNPGL